jgi:hypothetical protein
MTRRSADTEPDKTDAEGFASLADAAPGAQAMVGLDQPLWLQNSVYPAALDRVLLDLVTEGGVQGLGELAVTQRAAGANMSVDVAPGRIVISITDAPNQLRTLARSNAVNNLAIAGAPAAGLSRIDRVVAHVYDASLIGGSINGWQLEVLTGTPAASPVMPTLPPSCQGLAIINIAAGQASITNANITDQRVSPKAGWRSYTPAWLPGTGLGTGGSVAGRFTMVGPFLMHLRVAITIGPSPAIPASVFAVSLPPGYSTATGSGDQFGNGILTIAGRGAYPVIPKAPTFDGSRLFFSVPRGATLGVTDGSTAAMLEDMTGTIPAGWAVNGSILVASIVFEVGQRW